MRPAGTRPLALGELSPGAQRREQGPRSTISGVASSGETFTVRVALDDEGRVAGFFVLPGTPG